MFLQTCCEVYRIPEQTITRRKDLTLVDRNPQRERTLVPGPALSRRNMCCAGPFHGIHWVIEFDYDAVAAKISYAPASALRVWPQPIAIEC